MTMTSTPTPTALDVPSGPVLFARYAYPPNRLGLCGPEAAPGALGRAATVDERELRALALGFEGAYPYLSLIAAENDIADPLDRRVVESYWLGGGLGPQVGPRSFHRQLSERFRDRTPLRDWRWLERALDGGAHPSHAFHVLEVFPRVGLLRGESASVLETIDACRVRWGRVEGLASDRLVVSARRLELADGRLVLGAPVVEELRAPVADPARPMRPGDWVSVHWGWACDRLSETQVARLARSTAAALDLANRRI
jgi:hypothetical protein